MINKFWFQRKDNEKIKEFLLRVVYGYSIFYVIFGIPILLIHAYSKGMLNASFLIQEGLFLYVMFVVIGCIAQSIIDATKIRSETTFEKKALTLGLPGALALSLGTFMTCVWFASDMFSANSIDEKMSTAFHVFINAVFFIVSLIVLNIVVNKRKSEEK